MIIVLGIKFTYLGKFQEKMEVTSCYQGFSVVELWVILIFTNKRNTHIYMHVF